MISRVAPTLLSTARAAARPSPSMAARTLATVAPTVPTLRIRRAEPGDYPAISQLIHANRGLDAAPRELAEKGFVKGAWPVDKLAQLDGAPGFFLAEIGESATGAAPSEWRLAGAALSTAPGADARGPAGATHALAAPKFGDEYYLYGPVVVDSKFRQHGVLRKLNDAVFAATRDSYSTAVAFIEDMNHVSRVVHERLGWRAWDGFEVDQMRYRVFYHPTTTATA